jgi:hypothetical protein
MDKNAPITAVARVSKDTCTSEDYIL